MCYGDMWEENKGQRTTIRSSWEHGSKLVVLLCSGSLFGFGLDSSSLCISGEQGKHMETKGGCLEVQVLFCR